MASERGKEPTGRSSEPASLRVTLDPIWTPLNPEHLCGVLGFEFRVLSFEGAVENHLLAASCRFRGFS